ncbi:MAG: DUF424 family protein [Acidilobaceae archaeon]|nr:DUF424 family protein [Acidilobaceae archaeon]MCX8165162.1 DUF424 family protein [Acidilobaceae archaeon]MDW7974322.1 DUF424 family protein [Sulfolobales archaeon]
MSKFYTRLTPLPDGSAMVSIVDEELLGRKFRDKRGVMIDVSRRFYEGELVDEEGARELMREASVLILVGTRAVQMGIEMELVNPEAVLWVEGIAYAQVFKVSY